MAIVVGFIPTPEGHAALHRAAKEAQLRRTRLIVVSTRDSGQERDKAAVARFEDELRTLGGRLADVGVEHELRTFDRGRLPSEDLLEVAESVDADFIVIGLRQRSTVGKLLLGSQALQVLMTATCPVLSVRAEHSS